MEKRKPLLPGYALVVVLFLLVIQWGSRTVTVMTETRPIGRDHSIIIDAGHGGIDGGATSCTGKLESSFNLEIALRLNDLMHLLGHDTEHVFIDIHFAHDQGIENIKADNIMRFDGIY